MAAYRCSICAIDWPQNHSYMRCPVCDGPTWVCIDCNPLSEAEAHDAVAEATES